MKALYSAMNDQSLIDLSWLGPYRTPWILSDEALQLLGRLVSHVQPRVIVEFGSGVSTVCLDRACREAGQPCHIVSIDHDPEYQEDAKQLWTDLDASTVAFHLAPLVARAPCELFLPTYHLTKETLRACCGADLVLIDGPPDALGGREGVLYQVLDFVRPGALVLLDDADRPAEREALGRWQDNLGDAIRVEILEGFPKGLAAIIVVDPVCSDRLWNHRIGLTVKELADLCGKERKIALLDENQLGITTDHLVNLIDLSQDEGPPATNRAAIDRLKGCREAGADLLAITWPAFWWLTAYVSFRETLNECCPCMLQNARMKVYDLRGLSI
jgi:predicted O-methyltransferase YrrM